MKVKELISLFSSDTRYNILHVNNPHDIEWWGQGSRCNTTCDEEEVIGVSWSKKNIIIYIN